MITKAFWHIARSRQCFKTPTTSRCFTRFEFKSCLNLNPKRFIWHNPRCSKSRQTLALLQERARDIIIREYLEEAPSEAELRQALSQLGTNAIAIMRKGEALFKELGLCADDDDAVLIAAMAAHPSLIERPIVFANGRAAVGRPPEAILDIL